MLKRSARALLVTAGVMTVVLGVSTTAQAGDTSVRLAWDRGYMNHIDDGDKFKVCDTRADGYGVTGNLYKEQTDHPDRRDLVGSQSDGGDAGCDYFHYDVREGYDYWMAIHWHGNREGTTVWKEFNE